MNRTKGMLVILFCLIVPPGICAQQEAAGGDINQQLIEAAKKGDQVAVQALLAAKAPQASGAENDPGEHLSRGKAAFGKGDLDGALKEYYEAIRLNPQFAEAHTQLCLALHKKADPTADRSVYNGVLQECRTAVRLAPNSAEAHYALAEGLIYQGWDWHNDRPFADPKQAIEEYRAAIRLNPDFTVAHHHLGQLLADQAIAGKEKPDAAVAEYRAAIRLDPNEARVHHDLGDVLAGFSSNGRFWPRAGTGDYDGAIAEYQTVLRLEPNNLEEHYRLGMTLAKKGDWDGAIAEYGLYLASPNARDKTEAHDHLGEALLKKGDIDKAIVELQTAVRLAPGEEEGHLHLGMALEQKGQLDQALAEYRTALAGVRDREKSGSRGMQVPAEFKQQCKANYERLSAQLHKK